VWTEGKREASASQKGPASQRQRYCLHPPLWRRLQVRALQARRLGEGRHFRIRSRVHRMLPDRDAYLQLFDDPAPRLERRPAMSCPHSHEQGRIRSRHKSDSMVQDQTLNWKLCTRFTAQNFQLMPRHRLVRFVIDSADHAFFTLKTADHSPKIEDRARRPGKNRCRRS
jgi:hypothetical protein